MQFRNIHKSAVVTGCRGSKSFHIYYLLVLHALGIYVTWPHYQQTIVHPGMSYHVTQFYQAFPRISTASDKHLGEKAWVRGYLNDASLSTTSSCSIPFVCVC